MKTPVVSNDHYEIAVDQEKNRAYLTIKGFWRSPEDVKNYVSDLSSSLDELKSDFTLLVDLTTMKTHPPEVRPVHEEAQKILISKGLKQTAEVLESSIVQFQTEAISKKSEMPLQQFDNLKAAENFLDEVV